MNPFKPCKILGHLPVVNNYLQNKFYPPINVEIDLTNICNSACPWCYGYDERVDNPYIIFGQGVNKKEQYESSYVKVEALLRELAGLGVKSIMWTGGGEPTVHPYMIHLLILSHSLGLNNGLISNGVIVHDYLPYLMWVRYSVDAATEKGYALQHGKPHHFTRVLDNIKTVAESNEGDTTIGVGFLTNDSVIDEIVPFVHLWEDVPVDYIQFRPIMDHYGTTYKTNSVEIQKQLDIAKSLDNRVVVSEAKYVAMMNEETGTTKNCYGCKFQTAISADGLVYVCCHLKGIPEHSIGNLHEESFEEIWTRFIKVKQYKTEPSCIKFCRHYGTNKLFEEVIMAPQQHKDFI